MDFYTDLFVGAAGNLSGHTADTGQTYTQLVAPGQMVLDGAGECAIFANTGVVAKYSVSGAAPSNDYTAWATWTFVANQTNRSMLSTRWADANNHFNIGYEHGTGFFLSECIANVNVDVVVVPWDLSATGPTECRVIHSGNNHTLVVDGTPSAPHVQALLATGGVGIHGLSAASDDTFGSAISDAHAAT